jgi:hypothetical protein
MHYKNLSKCSINAYNKKITFLSAHVFLSCFIILYCFPVNAYLKKNTHISFLSKDGYSKKRAWRHKACFIGNWSNLVHPRPTGASCMAFPLPHLLAVQNYLSSSQHSWRPALCLLVISNHHIKAINKIILWFSSG